MKNWRQVLGNERGTALALALIILVIMTVLTLGLAAMGGVESRISASQSASSRARLLAESGIEYALLSLAATVDFSTLLATGPVLIPTRSMPPPLICTPQVTPCPVYGTFAVTIRNDIDVGDGLLTGAVIDPGSAVSDLNGIVVLTSTGMVDGATRVISAVVQRGFLNVSAAVTLPGVQADTFTDSPCQTPPCPPFDRNYSIDGRDWMRTDTTLTGPTGPAANLKLGIATGGTETAVENAFSDAYRQNFVQGLKEGTTGTLTTGRDTINADGALTSGIIQKFLTNLGANPNAQIIQSTQACQFAAGGGIQNKPQGIRMTSTASPSVVAVKNNCASGSSKVDQTINLGTKDNPQLIYFKGEFDPTSNFVGVAVDGAQPIQGYGLLVVEDADLDFFQTGKFRWDGIVLVTGRNVAVAFRGDSDTEIRGALIGNETNPLEPGGYFEFFNRTTDTMILRASKQNTDMALMALYNMRIASYRERELCSVAVPC
jgi:hypothetical protein